MLPPPTSRDQARGRMYLNLLNRPPVWLFLHGPPDMESPMPPPLQTHFPAEVGPTCLIPPLPPLCALMSLSRIIRECCVMRTLKALTGLKSTTMVLARWTWAVGV